MDFKYNICFYEAEKSLLLNNVNFENIKCLGFEYSLVSGDVQDVVSYLTLNKTDILVINDKFLDYERISCLTNIAYDNFCKNILIITEGSSKLEKTYSLVLDNKNNFDLKLEMKLMDIKRGIESNPSKNIAVLKAKIFNILNEFLFSNRHDGFYYYIDAVLLAYMKHPYNYFTMDLYKEVAKMHNKSISAVEKSMRMALIYAFNKLKNAPQTKEYDRLRCYLTYDLNNNNAIGMLKNMLLNDSDIKEGLINQKEFVFRR